MALATARMEMVEGGAKDYIENESPSAEGALLVYQRDLLVARAELETLRGVRAELESAKERCIQLEAMCSGFDDARQYILQMEARCAELDAAKVRIQHLETLATSVAAKHNTDLSTARLKFEHAEEHAWDLEDAVKDAKAEIEELRKQLGVHRTTLQTGQWDNSEKARKLEAELQAVKKELADTETELDRVENDNGRLYKENDRLLSFKVDYDRLVDSHRKTKAKLAECERDWEKERRDRLATLDELEDTKLRVYTWEMKYYEAGGTRPSADAMA